MPSQIGQGMSVPEPVGAGAKIALEEHTLLARPDHIERWRSLVPMLPTATQDELIPRLADTCVIGAYQTVCGILNAFDIPAPRRAGGVDDADPPACHGSRQRGLVDNRGRRDLPPPGGASRPHLGST